MLVSLVLLLNLGGSTPQYVSQVIAFNGYLPCDVIRTKYRKRYGSKLITADCVGSKGELL